MQAIIGANKAIAQQPVNIIINLFAVNIIINFFAVNIIINFFAQGKQIMQPIYMPWTVQVSDGMLRLGGNLCNCHCQWQASWFCQHVYWTIDDISKSITQLIYQNVTAAKTLELWLVLHSWVSIYVHWMHPRRYDYQVSKRFKNRWERHNVVTGTQRTSYLLFTEGLEPRQLHRVTSGLFTSWNLTEVTWYKKNLRYMYTHRTYVKYINIIRKLVPSILLLSKIANKVRRCWYH